MYKQSADDISKYSKFSLENSPKIQAPFTKKIKKKNIIYLSSAKLT